MYSTTNVITSNINELQSDILAEKLLENPYLKYHVLVEKNKKLGTNNQSIIGAINEVLFKVNSVSDSNRAALAELYNVLGHVGMHPELVSQVLSSSPSLIEMVLGLKEQIKDITVGNNIYEERFVVGETPQFTFTLSHVPIDQNIKIFVNGIQYTNSGGNVFSCDINNKKVYWLFSKMNGGFNLVDCEVIIQYNI